MSQAYFIVVECKVAAVACWLMLEMCGGGRSVDSNSPWLQAFASDLVIFKALPSFYGLGNKAKVGVGLSEQMGDTSVFGNVDDLHETELPVNLKQ